MAKIQFVDGSTRRLVTVAERAERDPDFARSLSQQQMTDVDAAQCDHYEGSETAPQLVEVRLGPGAKVPAHGHDADEIMVVTEGEAHFGRQVYGPGSSVFIPRLTLYSFQAGPEGLTFLNFRPHRSTGSLRVDEVRARTAAAAGEAE